LKFQFPTVQRARDSGRTAWGYRPWRVPYRCRSLRAFQTSWIPVIRRSPSFSGQFPPFRGAI
jgi:hypothetical protein